MDMQRRVNLERVSILALEDSAFSNRLLGQILRGFGIREIHSPVTYEEATTLLQSIALNVLIVDPQWHRGRGEELVRGVRRAKRNPNRFTPAMLVIGHSTASSVKLARDTGANLVVAKPYPPNILLERILWLGRDPRPYVEAGAYVAPDRRFKMAGPPEEGDRRDGAAPPADTVAVE